MKTKINIVDQNGLILKTITRQIYYIHGVQNVKYNGVFKPVHNCPEKPIKGTEDISRYYIRGY